MSFSCVMSFISLIPCNVPHPCPCIMPIFLGLALKASQIRHQLICPVISPTSLPFLSGASLFMEVIISPVPGESEGLHICLLYPRGVCNDSQMCPWRHPHVILCLCFLCSLFLGASTWLSQWLWPGLTSGCTHTKLSTSLTELLIPFLFPPHPVHSLHGAHSSGEKPRVVLASFLSLLATLSPSANLSSSTL